MRMEGAEHIAAITVRFDESLGLEGRAGYYDRAGALVDMIQSHLLQVLAILTMAPPATLGDADVRDATAAALRATHVWEDNAVRFSHRARYTAGTIDGRDLPDYAAEPGVDVRVTRDSALVREAETMLGHWHRIEGEVIHGEKRGRELGWPTAYMSVEGLHLPRLGVYAVLVDVLTGPDRGTYQGVASLGVRPMFGENRPNLEVNLFDFSGDLYGQHLSVALVDFLRDEARFDILQALIYQMEQDGAQARALLSGR